MKKLHTLSGCVLLLASSMGYAASTEQSTEPQQVSDAITITEDSPQAQQVGYGFGYIIGKSNSEAVTGLDVDAFVVGFKDGYQGKESVLTEERIKQVILKYKQQQDAQEMVAFKAASEKHLREGTAFLAENGKKSGVMTTKSGLQYQVLKKGSGGATPKSSSEVEVHYEGRLIDGTVFDSSIDRGEPLDFRLDKVIAGWTEGLQLMQKGAKYRFFIPSNLAYGETGAGNIPPNSALIFDVELLDIKK